MRIILVASFIYLSGCSTLERSMAGKIGCPHGEINILSGDSGWGVVASTLTAECRGRKFICSIGPDHNFDEMSCSPIVSKNFDGGRNLRAARSENFEEFVENLNQKAQETSRE